jgi:membrane protease YdiL (CAAX protease family)
MNFIPEEREENSAYLQLLMIVMFAIAGIIIGSILSVVAVLLLFGTAELGHMNLADGNDAKYVAVLKISQVLTTACLFILPPVWLAKREKTALKDFYGFKKPQLFLVVLVVLIMIFSMPVMEWVALANQKMTLPDALKPIENWMRAKEDEAMKMTILLLKVDHAWDFFINLFIIALLPAVAEEFIFRGAVQRSFTRMFHNPHVAIWITAIIFSAIHVQFFGFLPRLLLGAAFGYIYWWTGSLWYTMLAHFLNNAYAVCLAWYMQVHHMPMDSLDNSSNFTWYQYVISLLLSIFLLKFLHYKTKQNDGKQLG